MTPPREDDDDGSARRMTLTTVPASVAKIRRFAVGACQEAGVLAICDTVALLVSELATNAMVHGDGEVRVSVQIHAEAVRVEVEDDSAALPVRRQSGLESEGGRGLALVDALSSGWGVTQVGSGKTVWFEVSTAGHERSVG